MLTKDMILKRIDENPLPMESVDVPEWGGFVYVKTMNGTERDAFEAGHLDAKRTAGTEYDNIRARLAVATVCDDKGVRLFSFDEAVALGKSDARPLDRVFEAAKKLNKMRREDVAELEGN